jgi:hypothetical protein
MNKRVIITASLITLIGFFAAAGGAWAVSLSERYYLKHELKVEKLDRIWGKPVLVETLDNGLERRVYEIENPFPENLRYRFFMVSDGKVVSSGISDRRGDDRAEFNTKETVNLPKSKISESYYTKNPLSAEDVERTWGTPIQVKDMGAGLEGRVYEIPNPYPASMKYRYFLIQNNMVLASGITDIIGTQEKADTCGLTGPPVGRLSKVYYENNKLTVEEVDKVWGKPLAVQKIDNGMENRIYEIDSPYPATLKYRYFLARNGAVVASGISETPVCDIGIH